MILIVTEPSDVHANHVAKKLSDRGAHFFRFDAARFPAEAAVSLRYSAGSDHGCLLRVGDELVDLATIRAAWYRRPKAPAAHEQILHGPTRLAVAEECEHFVFDLWNTLDCLWVPGPLHVLKRWRKASLLRAAAAIGFEIPPTLISNSPSDLLEFYRQHRGQIVSKRVALSSFATGDSPFCRYTEPVTTRDIGYASALKYCPMIFQAYVRKRFELRVTVVGEEVFAAEIRSQKSNHARHDWRRFDHYQTPHLPHHLPDVLAQRCVELVQRAGLCYGAIDMVLTPDDRYVFLELNPNGQYLWIELATGLPISDAICDLLMFGPPREGPDATGSRPVKALR